MIFALESEACASSCAVVRVSNHGEGSAKGRLGYTASSFRREFLMALTRDWTKKAILASGALRFAGGFQGPSAAILMYHSVLFDPTRESDSLGGIVHSEPVFRAQIEMLARDYHPIYLDRKSVM